MITYEYECKACDSNFEVMQSIKDEAFTCCPECEQGSLVRVFHPPITIIKGEPTTMGQLAERNAKSMSKEQMAKVQERYKTRKTINRVPEDRRPKSLPTKTLPEIPKWVEKSRTKKTKDVMKMTPEQTKKYVQTGE